MKLSTIKENQELLDTRVVVKKELALLEDLARQNGQVRVFIPDQTSFDGKGSSTALYQILIIDLMSVLVKKLTDIDVILKAAGFELDEES